MYLFKLQFDRNDTMCTFRLENNGIQIRLTVWRTELHMIDKIGIYTCNIIILKKGRVEVFSCGAFDTSVLDLM